jgi:carbohydrate kinase (thermoresistant glucokinase family)
MGVSGSGKTTIGLELAALSGSIFIDADDLHTDANKARMHAGIPLTDADRAPWLDAIAARLSLLIDAGQGAVLACSALKRAYRDRLRQAVPDLRVVFLDVPADVLRGRLTTRGDHFMPASLLDSQFADLEPPAPDENAIVVGAVGSPEHTAREAHRAFNERSTGSD